MTYYVELTVDGTYLILLVILWTILWYRIGKTSTNRETER